MKTKPEEIEELIRRQPRLTTERFWQQMKRAQALSPSVESLIDGPREDNSLGKNPPAGLTSRNEVSSGGYWGASDYGAACLAAVCRDWSGGDSGAVSPCGEDAGQDGELGIRVFQRSADSYPVRKRVSWSSLCKGALARRPRLSARRFSRCAVRA